ncbi:MAG: phage major capsid protein [Muribaculaceae bacterium]|nr:phage major capsid protein [Muribaculaceae bacterium]MDE7465552.1 phage major capsid protein [Muribaculaceae bacterium]
MAKLTEKEVSEIFGVKTANLPDDQRTFINSMVGAFTDAINKSNDGLLDDATLASKLTALSDQMKAANIKELETLKAENATLIEQLKGMGEKVEQLMKKGVSLQTINKFDENLNKMFEADKFQEFVEGRVRKSGSFDGFSLKDTVSLSNNYQGDKLITQQQTRVVSPISAKPLHMRDVITTLQGDPEHTTLTYTKINWMDRNARYVSENGTLPASSIKAKEETTGVRRIGTHIRLSKRMLKSRAYIRSYILAMLPEAVFMAEDWNLLFGDGEGENLLGIVNHDGVKSVESVINAAVIEGKAGSIVSVKPYNGGADAIVEFEDAYPLMLDGFRITFAGASNTNLNTTFDIVKMTDRSILIMGLGAKMTEAEAAPGNMTFTVNNAAFASVDSPNSEDVIDTAFAVMAYAQYYPNAIVLNPATVNAIKREKDAIGRPLGLITINNGIKYISGRPIIEYTGIPAGKYLIGDFVTAANLVDYTSLSLEWASDVDTLLKNEVVLIAQEEVIFPVYMPWAFAYGDLSQLKLAITKPISPASIEGSVTINV